MLVRVGLLRVGVDNMKLGRISADNYDDAADKVWQRYPRAWVIQLRYLYCGWWEYTVWMEVA